MAEDSTTVTSTVTMEDGVRLNVKLLGEDSTKAKPLIISLHGAPGLSTHLEPEASYSFLSNIFRVLVYDARGSGASDKTGPYSHQRWIKDIELLRYTSLLATVLRDRLTYKALRQWAGAEKFILAGASYGAFIALNYAVQHGNRLHALILRGAWANGKLGAMNVLANILTSDKVKVDAARQVRVWSGTLRDDQDFQHAIEELLPFYAPPEDPSSEAPAQDQPESTEFKGTVAFHSATQNYAFSVNMPQFDVRDRLKTIKVSRVILPQYRGR